MAVEIVLLPAIGPPIVWLPAAGILLEEASDAIGHEPHDPPAADDDGRVRRINIS